ncbi:MAG: DNA recombination protein RmuC [Anaerolineae bacterium]
MELAILLVVVLVALVLWVAYRQVKADERLTHLMQRMPDVQAIDSLSQRLQEVDQTSRQSFERLAGNLGELSKATEQMMEVGKTISSLEDLLKPPKLRGGMGETLLKELLAQILPPRQFEIEHAFRSGERVDAIIRIGDSLVPVDAKFPLESFRRLADVEDEAQAKRARKEFLGAVKKHIDGIATKYILPDEGTYDFALMYIPAENVYYETIIRDESGEGLFPYAVQRKVIPVSPNSFYGYLQVIVRGLKGMRIEEHAREILERLGRLSGDMEKFRQDYDVLGGHLEKARKKYEDADRKLGRVEERILQAGERPEQLELPSGQD